MLINVKLVNKLRKARKWSYAEAARRGKFSRAQYYLLEKSKGGGTVATLGRLAEMYDVAPADLLISKPPPRSSAGRQTTRPKTGR